MRTGIPKDLGNAADVDASESTSQREGEGSEGEGPRRSFQNRGRPKSVGGRPQLQAASVA